MKLQFSPLLHFLLLANFPCRLRAIHFSQQQPRTITTIQPQTITTWVRDENNIGSRRLDLKYIGPGVVETFALTSVDEKQCEREHAGARVSLSVIDPHIEITMVQPPVSATSPPVYHNGFSGIMATLPTTGSDSPDRITVQPPGFSGLNLTRRASDGVNDSRAAVIGCAVGGVGFIIILTVFLLFRWKRGQRLHELEDQIIPRPLSLPPPRLDPYLKGKPPTPTPTSTQEGGEDSDRQIEHTGGDQLLDSQESNFEPGGGVGGPSPEDRNGPINQVSYQAIQAQIRMLVQRMERMEAADEAPPEYVSAHGSNR
ncbi:hypothetical protein PM082_014872 [Marasmius tenuissimus]|nr:hypothetical protein PM082_014872 [Marasmius tenuissimus]